MRGKSVRSLTGAQKLEQIEQVEGRTECMSVKDCTEKARGFAGRNMKTRCSIRSICSICSNFGAPVRELTLLPRMQHLSCAEACFSLPCSAAASARCRGGRPSAALSCYRRVRVFQQRASNLAWVGAEQGRRVRNAAPMHAWVNRSTGPHVSSGASVSKTAQGRPAAAHCCDTRAITTACPR